MGGSNSLLIFLILSSSISLSIALSFNFASFESTKPSDVTFNGDAGISGAGLDLNRDAMRSAGRALYRKPMQLWVIDHGNTAVLADFSTHFAFDVSSTTSSSYSHGGGGFSFVMVPDQDSSWSPSSYGGLLGLFGSNASALDGGAGLHHQVVAVEFDEGLDPTWDFSSDHVGIDVNSLKSKRYVNLTSGGFTNKGTVNVWVDYNSTTKNLSVSFAFTGNMGSLGVFHIVDLRDVLPERVQVGFTASVGSASVVMHRITSWSFSSPDLPIQNGKKNIWKGVGAGIAAVLLVVILVGIGICLWRWFISRTKDRDSLLDNRFRSDQFHPEDLADCGVKKVPYNLICEGTENFDPQFKIGEGASGAVYSCKLRNPERDVAVKRINRFNSSSSPQGMKEFRAELDIVSQVRHKNVVRLVYWSCSDAYFFLCFELMPNRSLDHHLRGEGITPLNWENRWKVMLGVASGVAYLHEGLEQCVIHRDIKSANVLLDAEYNAKVADFGVARLAVRNRSMQTTVEYATDGYVAPEIVLGGKASPQSDVYSFGMLSLEVLTGKDPRRAQLVSFVRVNLAPVDGRLGDEFNHSQAKRLLGVGLWCCNLEPASRPKMKDVVGVLDGLLPLPEMAGHSFPAEYHLPPAPASAPAPTLAA